jgi:hypothetical protein
MCFEREALQLRRRLRNRPLGRFSGLGKKKATLSDGSVWI